MKTILITGGGGFIGTNLAKKLSSDYRLILFDNFSRDSLQYESDLKKSDNVQVIKGDVLDKDLLNKVMDGVDIVIHLAAIAGVSRYYSESLNTLKVNIVGTLNVLEIAAENNVRQFIDVSTSEVYGPEAKNVSENSRHNLGPVYEKRWVYAVSKLASEHFTLSFASEKNLNTCCVRPFNIFGPGQTGEGAIRNFAINALKKNEIEVYGKGDDIRAWCYIDDFIEAMILILKNPEVTKGKIYNIGNPDNSLTTMELARLFKDHFDGLTIVKKESGHAPIPVRIPNIDSIRDDLNFHPKVNMQEGLKNSIAWYREQNL